jgi:hypothetical protein
MTAKRPVNLAVSLVANEQRRAIALLKEAADIIYEELYAAGADDVNEHPTLSSHARTHERIVAFLKSIGQAAEYGELP